MVVSQNKGTPIQTPKILIVLIIGTPKKGTPNLGKPHMGFHENIAGKKGWGSKRELEGFRV